MCIKYFYSVGFSVWGRLEGSRVKKKGVTLWGFGELKFQLLFILGLEVLFEFFEKFGLLEVLNQFDFFLQAWVWHSIRFGKGCLPVKHDITIGLL